MFLNNPAGLWALLGIPAVLAIHFLQRKAKALPVSTLFLLEKSQRESASGRRVDRLMNSIPLWMQLLAVLLLAWLLAEPRYRNAGSIQRVAVVLDSSASMSVFREELRETLARELPKLSRSASTLELTFLESAPASPRLYSGSSLPEALAALDAWRPASGALDPAPALQIARSLVGRQGAVVYVTDTPGEPPFEARLLAIGHPVANQGFTGVEFTTRDGAAVWTAVLSNYSDQPAERSWQVRYPDGSATAPQSVRMEPRGLATIQAALPAEQDRAVVVLDSDLFPLDDILPLVRPAPKRLSFTASPDPIAQALSGRLIESIEALEIAGNHATPDFTLTAYDPLNPVLPEGDAILFLTDNTRGGKFLGGGIIATEHPLVAGLNWQSLMVRETIQLDRQPADEVLLWQEERPLIFLHQTSPEHGPAARQLCFNFDLRLSNADTQPAFVVILHRFLESLREDKVAPYRANLETTQPLVLAARPGEPVILSHEDPVGGKTTTHKHHGASSLRLTTPAGPGFLSVSQGGSTLLSASLHFADTREADFSACASAGDLSSATADAALLRHTHPDPWWRLWVLLLLAALLVSWHFVARGAPVREATS